MKREEIIRDIHGLDAELAALEEQYGLLSADFYHFYRAGELEQSRDSSAGRVFMRRNRNVKHPIANWFMSTCASCGGVPALALWPWSQRAHEHAAG